MFRRRFLALMFCLVAALLPVASQAFTAFVQADQACTHADEGSAVGTDGCSMHCAGAACLVPSARVAKLPVGDAGFVQHPTVQAMDRPLPPDTAPPKSPAC